ncbi:MAG TPA: FAD-dependent oxidoreductase, partial [Agriterribacter sp.]|nr:FAD-dependent oxidoreductase [Agriterribacter sp.]
MKRRSFIRSLSMSSGAMIAAPAIVLSAETKGIHKNKTVKEISADVVIAGGGMGGCAAAITALRNRLRVVTTEESDWKGGQLTQQGLSCPDEHQWIE